MHDRDVHLHGVHQFPFHSWGRLKVSQRWVWHCFCHRLRERWTLGGKTEVSSEAAAGWNPRWRCQSHLRPYTHIYIESMIHIYIYREYEYIWWHIPYPSISFFNIMTWGTPPYGISLGWYYGKAKTIDCHRPSPILAEMGGVYNEELELCAFRLPYLSTKWATLSCYCLGKVLPRFWW